MQGGRACFFSLVESGEVERKILVLRAKRGEKSGPTCERTVLRHLSSGYRGELAGRASVSRTDWGTSYKRRQYRLPFPWKDCRYLPFAIFRFILAFSRRVCFVLASRSPVLWLRLRYPFSPFLRFREAPSRHRREDLSPSLNAAVFCWRSLCSSRPEDESALAPPRCLAFLFGPTFSSTSLRPCFFLSRP